MHPSIAKTAFTHCCPACGKGSLYAGVLRVAPSCAACGQSFAGEDSGDGPAFFVILVVGFFITSLAAIVEITLGLPLWLHAVLWVPVTFALSVWLLRVAKSGLLAWQYKVAHLEEKTHD